MQMAAVAPAQRFARQLLTSHCAQSSSLALLCRRATGPAVAKQEPHMKGCCSVLRSLPGAMRTPCVAVVKHNWDHVAQERGPETSSGRAAAVQAAPAAPATSVLTMLWPISWLICRQRGKGRAHGKYRCSAQQQPQHPVGKVCQKPASCLLLLCLALWPLRG